MCWQRTACVIKFRMRHEWRKIRPNSEYHQQIFEWASSAFSYLTVFKSINDDISDFEKVADAPPLNERNVKHHRWLHTPLPAFLMPEDIPSHSFKGIFQKAEELINENRAITKAGPAEPKMRTIESSFDLKPHLVEPKGKSKKF